MLFCRGWEAAAPAQAAPAPEPPRPQLLVASGAAAGQTPGGTASSPDGSWYVTGSGGAWQLWSAADNRELRRWSPAGATLGTRLAVASDNRTILSLGDAVLTAPVSHPDGNVTPSTLAEPLSVVDARSGRLQRTLSLPGASASLAASPVAPVFATLDAAGNTVTVRGLRDGDVLMQDRLAVQPSASPQPGTRAVFFSPDGSLLFAANPVGVTVWRWREHRIVWTWDAHAAHTPNLDRQVATAYAGRPVSTAQEEHYDSLVALQLRPDGQQLMLCAKDEITVVSVPHLPERPASGAPLGGDRLLQTCGYLGQSRVLTTTYLPANPGRRQTLLTDAAPGAAPTELGEAIDAVLPLPGGDRALVSLGNRTALVSGAGDVLGATPYPPIAAFHPAFARGGQRLLWRSGAGAALAWDLQSGDAGPVRAMTTDGYALAASGDGRRFTFDTGSALAGTAAWAVFEDAPGSGGEGHVVASLPHTGMAAMFQPALDGKGALLAAMASDTELAVFRVVDQRKLFSVGVAAGQTVKVALSPAGGALTVATTAGVRVYALPGGRVVAEFPATAPASLGIDPPAAEVRFSPDGRWLAVGEQQHPLRLVDTARWTEVRHLDACDGGPVAFSPDSRSIAYSTAAGGVTAEAVTFTAGQLVVDAVDTGTRRLALPGAYGWPVWSPDGRLLASADSGMALLDVAERRLLAQLWIFGGDPYYDWLVATPNGRFDGSPGAWQRASWRFDDDSFQNAPLELYFREFYRPGLLADVVAGRLPAAPVDIAATDRRQPVVRLEVVAGQGSAAPPGAPVRLRISVNQAAIGTATPTGAQDLRLFRNGVLVQAWHGALPLDAQGGAQREVSVPLAAGDNTFTAYAFSRSGIKSEDSRVNVDGPPAEAAQRTAFVFAIGIDRYEAAARNPGLALHYAVGDAEDFSSALRDGLRSAGQFSRVVTVTLRNEAATRANILAGLGVLGGAPSGSLSPAQQQLFADLRRASPDDGVFLFYAGHGVSGTEHFFLVPQDYDERTHGSAGAHVISDEELGAALEPAAPGRFFLVLDACYSGRVLDTDTAVGPFGGSTLAQLAYDKGLTVLAGADESEKAYEDEHLGTGHGYLTYALVEEGLRTPVAAVNGQVELLRWFDYARTRVPAMQNVAAARLARQQGRAAPTEDIAPQHPRIFYRREPEAEPLIVARPGAR